MCCLQAWLLTCMFAVSACAAPYMCLNLLFFWAALSLTSSGRLLGHFIPFVRLSALTGCLQLKVHLLAILRNKPPQLQITLDRISPHTHTSNCTHHIIKGREIACTKIPLCGCHYDCDICGVAMLFVKHLSFRILTRRCYGTGWVSKWMTSETGTRNTILKIKQT